MSSVPTLLTWIVAVITIPNNFPLSEPEKSVLSKGLNFGQFATVDFFLQKCWHDISKLKFNRNSRSFNLKPDEWSALLNVRKRKDITIKAADKGGAVVVWRTDLYQQEAFRQLSDKSFYCKVEKDFTPSN